MNVVRPLHPSASASDALRPITRSVFPADAHATISRASPPTLTAARPRKEQWKLQFERRSPLRCEPLMGWTEDDDPLAKVELTFPSAEAAMAYARRQGLHYSVIGSIAHPPQLQLVHDDGPSRRPRPSPRMRRKLEWVERTARPEAVLARGRGAAAGPR
ncbi:ETC complex I subunit [Bradyrhizobium sp. CB1015]|uniref:ETC complex I subunit n=1 Tax=Bradyrhizobium sp. CB1015 TaxID=2976822 RepID=UPI0021AAF586|nr:ETC complex I subunit [Bradyrhizobium sp. CB1015]UWU89187.1 ETC complex I subunit [Bradyrhizobium sp. CB1015]